MSIWNQGEPPRDGITYTVRGVIVQSYGGVTDSRPFVSDVHFGLAGWTDEDGGALARELEDEILIKHWVPLP